MTTDVLTSHDISGQIARQGTIGISRSRFRFSDIWRAPFTDLPIRDEILYQYLPLSPELEFLQVGPGTGFVTFRLSRWVKSLVAIDVAAESIAALKLSLNSLTNLELYCEDVCAPGLSQRLVRKFDVVEATDVLGFLPDPAAAIRNMSKVLRPQGVLFLQFPNYKPERSRAVSYFEKRADLDAVLQDSGFKDWDVYELRLRPFAAWIYHNFHERPLNLYRKLQSRNRPVRPLTFDEVWTGRNRSKVDKYKVPLYLIWMGMITFMRLGGDCFNRTRLDKDIMDRNLLVIARR